MGSHSSQTPAKLIEPGLTVFSAAEIRVAVVPIGSIPEEVMQRYVSLIATHKQVELSSFQSIVQTQSKSPLKSFPWKTGAMHFRFLPEDVATKASPLASLHVHRRVLGVIGILHCPAAKDFEKAYSHFQQLCRAFPEAFTLRCFAFEPSDEQVDSSTSTKDNMVMFPPVTTGGVEVLVGHSEVVMCDFAACLLAELECWMLNASPAMIDLNSFADTSDYFTAPTSALEEVSKRLYTDEELVRKKRYGRLQKALADISLLAGSPADAQDHYTTAAELCRVSNDWLWTAAALQGLANAKVLEACLSTGAMRNTRVPTLPKSPLSPDKRIARLQAEETSSAASSTASRGSSHFGGHQFWGALQNAGLEREVRGIVMEAKAAAKRKGAFVMMVEQDLMLARFLAGLYSHKWQARREVSDLVSSMVEAGGALPLPEDRLLTIMEAAQVIGLVGSSRKRTLMLWQAVELSRMMQRPDLATLQIARKALEPPDDPLEQDTENQGWQKAGPVQSGVPRHWGSVRCGCIEGVLATAILAGQHPDVWDAAGLLLREHYKELPTARQVSLLETLAAAASQMAQTDKARPGAGPPPLLFLQRALPPAEHLRPQHLNLFVAKTPAESAIGTKSPFIFNAFAAREEQARPRPQEGPAEWVCGETASVDILIQNPTSVTLRIERMTLEAEHTQDPALAPVDHRAPSQTLPAWRGHPVQMQLPPKTGPVKVTLSGVPLVKGFFIMTGCRMTFLGVTWLQPWNHKPLTFGRQLQMNRMGVPHEEEGGGAETRVNVVPELPLLEARLDAPSLRTSDAEQTQSSMLQSTGRSEQQQAQSQDKQADVKAVQHKTVVALKGQQLQWRLLVANSGKLPVTGAVLTGLQLARADKQQGTTDESPSVKPQIAGLQIVVDQEAVTRALPLVPGTRMTLPLMLHSPQASTHGADEEASLQLKLEYISGPEMPEEGPGEPKVGRHLLIPLRLHLVPSLQVNSISFFEHHVLEGDGETSGRSDTAAAERLRRECVMEAEVTNRTDGPLQVWVRRQPGNNRHDPTWQELTRTHRSSSAAPSDQDELGGSRILRPRQRVTLTTVLDLPSEAVAAAAMTPPEAAALPGGSAAQRENLKKAQQKQRESAVWRQTASCICANLAVYWRREGAEFPSTPTAGAAQAPQAAIGTLRFHPDTLQRALTDQALGLILPATLHISFQPPHHPDQLSSTQPSSSQEPASQPQSNGESGQPQQHPQLSSLSSQQGSQQYSQQLSQQLSQQAIGKSRQGPQWRRLSGGPEGAGFGGNRGSVWAMVASVGSLVPLTMQVENRSDEERVVGTSLACHGSCSLSSSRDRPLEDPNVMFAGAFSGLQLKVQSQSTIQHPVSLCFLSPGIYSLYAYDVHQLSDHAKPSEEPTQQSADMPSHASSLGVTAVNAAYFLVE
ncbi:TPA: hypothetical protein ACH3X3_013374 [Trebouxia sp. C0006]